MPESIIQTSRGGSPCPPLSLEHRLRLVSRLSRAVCIILAACAAQFAAAQNPPSVEDRNPQHVRGQAAGAPNRFHPGEMRARKLLKMLLKPTQQWVGVQETMIYENGSIGVTSVQDIEGDTNGFIKVTFRSPANVKGDVMIIAPGSFHSYHAAERLLEVAPWPTEWNDESKRMFANLVNGTVSAWINGREIIADRQAAIVVLTVPNGVSGAGRILRKLWIDENTGILLKIQKMNAQGQTVSTTTMQSVTVNPAIPINPNDFKPQFPGATVSPLFPAPQYRTMQDAQGHLPFAPVEPQAIPANFHMDGVWGFGEDRTHPFLHSVLLRYTDGVANFSLYERLVPPAKQGPIQGVPARMFARSQQMWRIQTQVGEMNVQYIGHLSARQAAALYDSLR